MLYRLKNLFREESGKEVADTLEAFGYFWYAPPAEVGLLKKEISNAFEEYGMLSSIYAVENGKHYPKDYRLYSLDNEVLFEKGGFRKYLAEIQPTFKKLHIPVVIEEDKEEYSEAQGFTHSITINGTRYPILKNFRNFSRGGAVATRKFIETVNKELEKQNSDERVYPISRGLDGQLIFLTQKQFNYIRAVYPHNENKPLKLKEWVRKYGAK